MTRLLMTAYACDPNQGSESGAGWALLSAASELCESITVVTRSGELPHWNQSVNSSVARFVSCE